MPLTPQQVGERAANWINGSPRILEAMERAWSAPVRPPEFIIVGMDFARGARRTLRPPRVQFGGSGIRAIKRRAVRRPW